MPTISVAAGCVSTPLAVPARSIITVTPMIGASAFLEYTTGSTADIANGVAQWSGWPKGAVNNQQQDIINEPAFLRLTATGAAAVLTTEESPAIMARETFNADWGGTKRHPYILAQSAVPVVLLSSATSISATGAIAGLTALPYQPDGVVQVHCFAKPGLAAGLYYARFSSLTACQLYTDVAGTVTPAGITPGAYTAQTNGYWPLVQALLPGGAMGPNGAVRITYLTGRNAGGTSAVNHGVFISGADIASYGSQSTGNVAGGILKTMRNRGSQNSQVTVNYGNDGGINSLPPYRSSFDMSTDKFVQVCGGLVNASDCLILEGYTIEVLPG